MKRVLVAMSGGVDSSVAAHLISRSGVDAVGVTLLLHQGAELALDEESSCCSTQDAMDARDVAHRLGMEHHIFNFGAHFREHVIDRFVATYESGGTPNPCIDCNRFIKWRELLLRADGMGCTHIATGHYAQIERDPVSGRMLLRRAADARKDQTYVLWALTQDQLSRTIFPLGGMSKDEVRRIAGEQGLINADKPDSQDICFVPDGDYAGFIERYTGKTPAPGKFIDAAGNVLGEHRGIIRYTIGQRKGLGIAMGRPIFVTKIDPAANTVTLGDEPALFSRQLDAHGINLIALPKLDAPLRVTARARYGKMDAPATVFQTGEDTMHVEFDEPQRALTRGQSVVLYDGDVVVGGGIIS
ncbi:MAG: tRNA 2-thiouridine(34) synthase MnmA [Clostridia bacterium]|nr:tRNA 2-thiouridine(34) synthase MnmA [Clostridia bacterium]